MKIVIGLSHFSNTAGKLFISDPLKASFDITDPLNSIFTLTCLSYNGPPTTVTWTRQLRQNGPRIAVPDDDDHRRSWNVTNILHIRYDNMLTVKGNEPGRYRCCASNIRGGDCSLDLILEGKTLSN